MAHYSVKFVHRVAPSDSDRTEVDLPDGAFSDRNALGRALRKARILVPHQRVKSFRVEGSKVVVFPTYGVWHSIVLTGAS